MPKAREELRRGVRDLIEVTSREMEALAGEAASVVPAPQAQPPERPDRPILRLVREPTGSPSPVLAPGLEPVPPDVSSVHPRRGVCAAYYITRACWNVDDAYCNQALHVCMLRDCPVYHLNRDELERRFAAKFAHLW